MQPVEPSTIVRGPDALTMCRMTSADSQPWQVRWPETKSSSYGTSLTPLIGGRVPVPCVSTAIIVSLIPHADPVTDVTGCKTAVRGGAQLVEHLAGHRLLDLTSAQRGDEADDRRPLVDRIQRRPDLVVEDAPVVRRAEAVIAVDDPDRRRGRGLSDLLGGGEAGPVQADRHGEGDALALADAPGGEREVQGLLRRLGPAEQPAEIADREGVVVLAAERAGVIERAVAADRDDREAEAGCHRDRLHRVEPADP